MGRWGVNVDGRPYCEHVFCDRRVSRRPATWSVTREWKNGSAGRTTDLICDEHLPVLQHAWRHATYTVQRIWWASEPDGRCPACGGRTWVGEPWSPDSCPECKPITVDGDDDESEVV